MLAHRYWYWQSANRAEVTLRPLVPLAVQLLVLELVVEQFFESLFDCHEFFLHGSVARIQLIRLVQIDLCSVHVTQRSEGHTAAIQSLDVRGIDIDSLRGRVASEFILLLLEHNHTKVRVQRDEQLLDLIVALFELSRT